MAQQTFRSAFNGFNREDVVRYIEYLNARHTTEINRLQSELEFLRSSKTQEAPATKAGENDELIEQQAARIRELFDQCKAQEETIAELTARLAEAAQPSGEAEQQVTCKSCTEEELEAYRRAERAERVARERAEQVYRQTNAVLADATAKVDDAVALISRMADHASDQLTQLQSAVTDSKQALCDAAATMYAIRPDTDNQ